jgi:hypothetical protein
MRVRRMSRMKPFRISSSGSWKRRMQGVIMAGVDGTCGDDGVDFEGVFGYCWVGRDLERFEN